jgi:hypothetical protein
MRQIDITLRHHEQQNYDAIYKEVHFLVNPLQLRTLNGIKRQLF